ncbi:hypothetical protein DPMN_010358 [Dreissena polymorpha]|uniref:D-isomer specific 2-hydroxyacid dehydrogenase NAD-binding domain-containing protein n=1 Tax=Dreissena polymorpha TaxID=45954 RepID=A0A9D4MYM8_DREPO|nr:hypothetical protein DPMN_010358 [Dreissena polymorpha]
MSMSGLARYTPQLDIRHWCECRYQSLVDIRPSSIFGTIDAPALQNAELAEQIEYLFADVPVIAKYYKALKNVKWVHTWWNGVDGLTQHTEKENFPPTFVLTKSPGCLNATLINEYVLGYIIAHERLFFLAREQQARTQWNMAALLKTGSLADRTVGILGVGDIGKRLAEVLKGFGMTVWGLTRTPHYGEQGSPFVDEYRTTEFLPELLKNCDYVVNVLPSTPQTRNLLSGGVLEHCRHKQSVFINVGRGDVVDEENIVLAIKNKWLRGAVLDVFATEPLPASSTLWSLPDVIITPHVSGWSNSDEFGTMYADVFIENVDLYFSGQPLKNVISWKHGY